MGKTLKRQRQRALREQQQQQQDAGPCKLPRMAGMPALKPSSSCSKYTFVVSKALQQGKWLTALQTLEAMITYGKVPKLGAIQRWVRDADQAGDEAVTARLIDAICRSTLPAGKNSQAASPAAAEHVLKGSVKRHPPWQPPPAAAAAAAGCCPAETYAAAAAAAAMPGVAVQQPNNADQRQQPSSCNGPDGSSAVAGIADLQQQEQQQAHQQQDQKQKEQLQLPDYCKLFYQVLFAPGNGGPDAIYAYPPNTIQFNAKHPPVTAVQVPFVPEAQCLLGVLSAWECEQIMAAAEAIGYNANVDYTFAGTNGGDGAAEQQQQQQQQQQQDNASENQELDSDSEQPQQQQQQQQARSADRKLYSTLNPGGQAAVDLTPGGDGSSSSSSSTTRSAARGLAADLVGLPQGGPAAGCVWLVDASVLQPVFQRVAHLLPQELGGGKLAGLNARWRLYRYTPGNVYRPHIDGAWPGSGLDDEGRYVFDAYGDRWSRLTFLVYLNDDFEGGHTTYYTPSEKQVGCLDARGVRPVQGNVMVFPHGGTVGSLVHEGSAVLRGAKYVIRTDVLYMKVESGGRRAQQQQQQQRH